MNRVSVERIEGGPAITMMNLVYQLRHTPRLLLGPGVRAAVQAVLEHVGSGQLIEIPGGTKVGDWTVPQAWRCRRAALRRDNEWWADTAETPLAVVGYSAPVSGEFDLDDIPIHTAPGATPYVTAPYADPPVWGFCMPAERRAEMPPGEYRVSIDAERFDEELTIGEIVIPGESEREVALASYLCHPAPLGNNESSGPVVLAELGRWLASEPRRYTYRLILTTETIGPVAYLHQLGDDGLREWRDRLRAGFTLTCMGGDGDFYLQQGRAVDYAARIAAASLLPWQILDWQERVSDERQWCAPGVDLPWCTVMKTHPRDESYRDAYHTSADDERFCTEEQLQESVERMKAVLTAIEEDRRWRSVTVGEPQLGRRQLYDNLSKVGSSASARELLDVWSYADGRSSLDIAEAISMSLLEAQEHLRTLAEHGIVEEA